MQYLPGSLCRCAVTVPLVLASANPSHAQGAWTITDLGTLGGLYGDAQDCP